MPVIHAAMSADDRSRSCIVMEDLAGLRQPDRLEGVTWDQAVLGIRALARFHADWHGSNELPSLTDPFVSIGAPLYRLGLPGVAVNGWPRAKEHSRHVLSDSVVAFGDTWVDRLDTMLDHMCTSPTLCHLDWRADNMFIRDDAHGGSHVVMIDPQLAGVANGAFDIGYFVSQSMERSVRLGRGRELIQHYVSEMAASGHRLDIERVVFDTRVAVGLCLMYGFASYAQFELLDESGQAMTEKLLRRAAQSVDDFGADAAIRGLTTG